MSETIPEILATFEQHIKKNQHQQAESVLQAGLKEYPNDALLLLQLANLYKTLQRTVEAESVLLTLIKVHPLFPAGFNNLGALYCTQEKWKVAQAMFETALDLQPNYIDAYYNLGLALSKQHLYSAAINAYESLLALEDKHHMARFQYASLLMRIDKLKQAMHQFEMVAVAVPHHFETQTNLATCYLKTGQLAEARRRYEIAADLMPNDIQVLFNLGVICAYQGEFARAIQYYQKAIQLDDSVFAFHNNLGVAFLAIKEAKPALHAFQKALLLEPNNEAVQHIVRALSGQKPTNEVPVAYVSQLFDGYAHHYDTHLQAELNYQVPQEIYQAAQQINLAKESVIVDLGCGTGLCGMWFKGRAVKLIGVDLSPEMLKVAAAKQIYDELIHDEVGHFLQTHVGDIDLLLAADVLVYMGDLQTLFKHAFEALKFGGYFIFNTEINESEAYAITPSGRFQHKKSYIDEIISKTGFNLLQYRTITLRTQDKQKVFGHLYLLKK